MSPRRLVRRLRPHLTYANVMSTLLAIVVIGGGTAVAKVHKIIAEVDSVGTAKLKDGSVTGQKLAPDSVLTGNVADIALAGSKLANGAVGPAQIDASLDALFAPAPVKFYFAPGGCGPDPVPAQCEADVFSVAGLTVHAKCSEIGVNQETLELSITQNGGAVNFTSRFGNGGTFSAADAVNQGGLAGTGVFLAVPSIGGGDRRGVGELIYNNFSTGEVYAFDYSAYATHVGINRACEFYGQGSTR